MTWACSHGAPPPRSHLHETDTSALAGTGEPAQRTEAVKLLDFLGMSQRQVILAVIVGVLLAAVLMWLAPDLIVR